MEIMWDHVIAVRNTKTNILGPWRTDWEHLCWLQEGEALCRAWTLGQWDAAVTPKARTVLGAEQVPCRLSSKGLGVWLISLALSKAQLFLPRWCPGFSFGRKRLIRKARCFCDSCEGKGDVCSDVTDKETALGVLESDRHGGGSSASHSYGSSLQALC